VFFEIALEHLRSHELLISERNIKCLEEWQLQLVQEVGSSEREYQIIITSEGNVHVSFDRYFFDMHYQNEALQTTFLHPQATVRYLGR
jgi:hypothetical protein